MNMKSSFAPRLKALASEEMRKEDLRKELTLMMDRHNELARITKRYKDYEYMHTTYALTRQVL
jgi:hypothetical protein